MSINRRVKYYLHGEAQDGVYPYLPNQYETAEGVLIEFANSIKEIDGKSFQVTEAIIEDIETPEIKLIDMCFASCEKEEWTDDSPIIQFKDPKFLEALVSYSYEGDRCDKNNDGQISEKEASVITTLYVINDIRNMDEIKYFTALTKLSCYNNQLTSLDLSKNTALISLSCPDNQLTSLDLSKNTALTELYCYGNQLTSLDLSKNTALTFLNCTTNQLTSLDLSGCTALEYLNCSFNQLTSLDLSNNTALTQLDCDGNQLTSLDVSNNTALTELWCMNNQLTSLDLGGCTALELLRCNDNQLTSLDLSGCTALESLWCFSNDITSLDVSMCRGLEYFQPVCKSAGVDYDTKLPLESLKIYKYHILNSDDIYVIEEVYGDIIEYVE